MYRTNCEAPIVDADSGLVVGEICHIKGRSANGPRYDAAQSDEERNGYENLLVMCNPHNKVVDHHTNLHKYTVEVLMGLKNEHEAKFRRSLIPIDVWTDEGGDINYRLHHHGIEGEPEGLDPHDPGAVEDLSEYLEDRGISVSQSEVKQILERLVGTAKFVKKFSEQTPDAAN